MDRAQGIRVGGRPLSVEHTARALILLAALISFALSVTLWFVGNEHQGIFVGLWVPSILSLGAIVLRRDGR